MSEMTVRRYYATFGGRRDFRKVLGLLCFRHPGADFHEEKGWLKSIFHLRAPKEAHDKLAGWIKKAMSE